jgi:formylglycine-generating enzyme required for sulfatase activity
MKLVKILPALFVFVLCDVVVVANNIQVTNPALANNNTSTGTCFVQFNILWENSWRLNGVVNWDAAWVFVKYKNPAGVWQHARLDATGHMLPANAAFDTGLLTPGSPHDPITNPVIGGFLRRGTEGSGTYAVNGVQLRWNYFSQGVGFNDITEVRVFAVEMVYVNQGAFYLGSGGMESNSFTDGSWVSGPSIPFQITSEGILATDEVPGALSRANPGLDMAAGINPPYPKGFRAFYCMKYEISQQQYVDFLNTLTRVQQDARTQTDLSSGIFNVTNRYVMSGTSSSQNRNSIRCNATIASTTPVNFYCDLNGTGGGGDPTDGLWIACNYLSSRDLEAYLDWSGLRPMTIFEFEKACRGMAYPTPNEFAWGTSTLQSSSTSLMNSGAFDEVVSSGYSTTTGNAAYGLSASTWGGPARVGMFAAHPNNNGRITSGSSYYGIMDLSGNVWERAINISGYGSQFEGHMGDGSLSAGGNATVPYWPLSQFDICHAMTFVGGAYTNPSSYLCVSDKYNWDTSECGRLFNSGGRGIRTAP